MEGNNYEWKDSGKMNAYFDHEPFLIAIAWLRKIFYPNNWQSNKIKSFSLLQFVRQVLLKGFLDSAGVAVLTPETDLSFPKYIVI